MNHGLTNSTQMYYVKGSRFNFSGCEVLAELLGIFGTMEVCECTNAPQTHAYGGVCEIH